MQTHNSQLERLRARERQLIERRRQLEARQRAESSRREARQQLIIGAAVVRWAAADADAWETITAGIGRHVAPSDLDFVRAAFAAVQPLESVQLEDAGT
jgi:hypothetical protein